VEKPGIWFPLPMWDYEGKSRVGDGQRTQRKIHLTLG